MKLLEALRDEINPQLQQIIKDYWGEKYLDANPALNKIPSIPDGDYPITTNIIDIDDFLSKLYKQIEYNESHPFRDYWDFYSEFKKIITTGLVEIDKKFLNFIDDTNKNKITLLSLFDKIYPLFKRDGSVNWNVKTSLYKFLKSIQDFNIHEKISVSYTVKNTIKLLLDRYDAIANISYIFKNQINTLINLHNEKPILRVSSKPEDILYMSVSPFYTSCQNIYHTQIEKYRKQKNIDKLLANVFDKNSKIVLIGVKKPFTDVCGKKHDFTPVYRVMIRQIDNEIYIDKIYGYKDVIKDIIKELDKIKKDDSVEIWDGTSIKYKISYEEEGNDLLLLYELSPIYTDRISIDDDDYYAKKSMLKRKDGLPKVIKKITDYITVFVTDDLSLTDDEVIIDFENDKIIQKDIRLNDDSDYKEIMSSIYYKLLSLLESEKLNTIKPIFTEKKYRDGYTEYFIKIGDELIIQNKFLNSPNNSKSKWITIVINKSIFD